MTLHTSPASFDEATFRPDPLAVAPVTVESDALRIEVLRDLPVVTRFAGYWRELEATAQNAVVFQSAAWCQLFLRVAAAADRNIDLRIYCAYRGNRLIAVWPLKRERTLGATVLTDLTDPYGQYADVVIAAGLDPLPVLDALFATARADSGADTLLLRKVRTDAALAPWLVAKGARFGPAEEAPAIRFSPGVTVDTLRAGLSVKRRKNLRNLRNKLKRNAPLEHHFALSAATEAGVIARSMNLRQELMEEQGATSRAFLDGLMPSLFAALSQPEAADLDVLVMRLRSGDSDVAIQWGLVHNRRYHAYIAARNPQFDDCSPGTLHLEDVLTVCHGAGVEVVDLLAPSVSYKRTWATEAVPVRDATLAVTRRGAALQFWQQRVRPRLREGFLALPGPIRRPIARLLRTKA